MKLSKGTQAAAALAAMGIAGLLAIPGPAQAAVAGTGASAYMIFQSSTVTAGTQPQVTFITSGAPAGAIVYVQEEGAGQPWHSIGRVRALSGTVDLPADNAGSYEYRIAVVSGTGTVIVTSAPAALTVTSADGAAPPAPAGPAASASGGGDGCEACGVVVRTVPWLALIVGPSTIWDTITSILTTVGEAILAFFGL